VIDQIRSEFGNYIGSNVFAILLVLLAARWPRVARLLFSVGFIGAGIWNMTMALMRTTFYVATYGPLATPPYQAFIYGPFAANPALFVVPVAIGELAIGMLAIGKGNWLRLGMVGVVIFLAAIAPMGVGSAFPFSIFGIVAAYLLFRKPWDTTLFEDIKAVLAGITRRFQTHGHARLSS
jgi:hypothetical protein